MTRATRPGRASKELTFEAWQRTPETMIRHEIVDGVIELLNAPTWDHQIYLLNLSAILRSFVRDRELGLVVISPADVVIRKRPKLRVRQPDLMYFSDARAGFRCRSDRKRLQVESIAPEIIIDFLSPGQDETSLSGRLDDFASIGVAEAWLIDMIAQTVEVLALRPDGRIRVAFFGLEERLSSASLPGFEMEVADSFAD